MEGGILAQRRLEARVGVVGGWGGVAAAVVVVRRVVKWMSVAAAMSAEGPEAMTVAFCASVMVGWRRRRALPCVTAEARSRWVMMRRLPWTVPEQAGQPSVAVGRFRPVMAALRCAYERMIRAWQFGLPQM